MALDPHLIASTWLASFASAAQSGDADAFGALFLPDGWLRDLLVFTWDIRSLEGRGKVASYVANTLADTQITEAKLDDTTHLTPQTSFIPQIHAMDVEFALTFECRNGHARGYIRLLPDQDGTFKALTALLMLSDIRGHEEEDVLTMRDDREAPGGDTQRAYAEWARRVETNPYVLISESSHCRCEHDAFSQRRLTFRSWCWTDGRASCCALQGHEYPYARYRTPQASR